MIIPPIYVGTIINHCKNPPQKKNNNNNNNNNNNQYLNQSIRLGFWTVAHLISSAKVSFVLPRKSVCFFIHNSTTALQPKVGSIRPEVGGKGFDCIYIYIPNLMAIIICTYIYIYVYIHMHPKTGLMLYHHVNEWIL